MTFPLFKSLFGVYEEWLDDSLNILKRVKQKMEEMPLQEVIDSAWEMKNFSVKGMLLSIMNGEPIRGSYSGNDLKIHLENEYAKWKNKNRTSSNSSSNQWWEIRKE